MRGVYLDRSLDRREMIRDFHTGEMLLIADNDEMKKRFTFLIRAHQAAQQNQWIFKEKAEFGESFPDTIGHFAKVSIANKYDPRTVFYYNQNDSTTLIVLEWRYDGHFDLNYFRSGKFIKVYRKTCRSEEMILDAIKDVVRRESLRLLV